MKCVLEKSLPKVAQTLACVLSRVLRNPGLGEPGNGGVSTPREKDGCFPLVLSFGRDYK